MSDETYNGWKNRETWAFWLHVTNDQGWYESVREYVRDTAAARGWELAQDGPEWPSDYLIGQSVVGYVRVTLEEQVSELSTIIHDPSLSDGNRGRAREAHEALSMMRDEIGSWWRIDYAEIGAAARELAEEES